MKLRTGGWGLRQIRIGPMLGSDWRRGHKEASLHWMPISFQVSFFKMEIFLISNIQLANS